MSNKLIFSNICSVCQGLSIQQSHSQFSILNSQFSILNPQLSIQRSVDYFTIIFSV